MREVAQRLSITILAVKGRLHRGRSELRQRLMENNDEGQAVTDGRNIGERQGTSEVSANRAGGFLLRFPEWRTNSDDVLLHHRNLFRLILGKHAYAVHQVRYASVIA
jgi:hypothetical protein